jgi:hypothetical protein
VFAAQDERLEFDDAEVEGVGGDGNVFVGDVDAAVTLEVAEDELGVVKPSGLISSLFGEGRGWYLRSNGVRLLAHKVIEAL